ncbi:MAG: acyl-CoA dehydrogenase family protein [Candidatus Latescibacterota bacterium]
MSEVEHERTSALRTLPGDEVRQIMWRFADRFDLQMLVQASRGVARGPVARLVAQGERNTHEWTEGKNVLLEAYDTSGITAAFMDPEHGGLISGPKNMALALIAFELAWVDGGAATGSLAGNLALSPIHERGTPAQRATYMGRAVPPAPGGERRVWRGAFCLTEPLPYVGVDTGVLSGKVRVALWLAGQEPVLQVDKRGRFITNMDFATFVVAAVDTGDERIKSSCMIILEEGDPGTFDRGAATQKLVHQLSSTRDPIFSLRVPASRIVGGYEVQDGVIVPRYSHGQVIEAVFSRTRVTVSLMSAAKLLSAVEPVIRYQRGRFRGGEGTPGTPRHDLGLQMKEDALHRLLDVWATGEASASLGFAAARLFDEFDPLEKEKERILAERGVKGARAQVRALRQVHPEALEFLDQEARPESERDAQRHAALAADPLVQFLVRESLANVLCPACKLWNTGYGATMMREAVSLMGGYGITEDCPGFLGQKWMDAQLEATYEGPEAVQRRQLSVTMASEVFLAQFRQWVRHLRQVAAERPGTGACALASAMELWDWTLGHLLQAEDALGHKLYRDQRQGVTFPMADALAWLLGARYLVLDVLELADKAAQNPTLSEGAPGLLGFYTDLCHLHVARAAGEVGRVCAELVFGYNRHPSWDGDAAGCYAAPDLEHLEGIIPGIGAAAGAVADVLGEDGGHPAKAGPCVRFDGYARFAWLRARLDGCLTGARLAKDRAAESLTQVMVPEALDYPL